MDTDLVPGLLWAVIVLAAAMIPLYALRRLLRQTRGAFGRPYGRVVRDMMQEGTRRSALLLSLVDARETRLARLERRSESGR